MRVRTSVSFPLWVFSMRLLVQIQERLVQIQERLVQIRGALVQIRPGYHHTRWRGVWCDTSVASPTLTDSGRVHRWRRPPPLRSPRGRGRGRRGGVAHLDAALSAGRVPVRGGPRRARGGRGGRVVTGGFSTPSPSSPSSSRTSSSRTSSTSRTSRTRDSDIVVVFSTVSININHGTTRSRRWWTRHER